MGMRWRLIGIGYSAHREQNRILMSNPSKSTSRAWPSSPPADGRQHQVCCFFPFLLSIHSHTYFPPPSQVYLYIINYARTQPELALLPVNSFCKDTQDMNPLIRALAVRTMGCIRLDQIVEYLLEPLRRCCQDSDPYVRKTAAICIPKVHEINPDLVEEQGRSLSRVRNQPNREAYVNGIPRQRFETLGHQLVEMDLRSMQCGGGGRIMLLLFFGERFSFCWRSSELLEVKQDRVLDRSWVLEVIALDEACVVEDHIDVLFLPRIRARRPAGHARGREPDGDSERRGCVDRDFRYPGKGHPESGCGGQRRKTARGPQRGHRVGPGLHPRRIGGVGWV